MSERIAYLLLGDWGRVIRDPIDLVRTTYVVGTVVLLVIGNEQTPRMAATAALVVFARFLNLPRPFDLGLCVGVGFQAWGKAFGLYEGIGWYDLVVHTFMPMLVSPLSYIALARLEVVPDLGERVERHHYAGVFLITFSVTVAFGATAWEIYEYAVDALFGTNLYKGAADSVGDMAATMLGAAAGGLLLVLWATRGWGTSRRAPARRLRTGAAG